MDFNGLGRRLSCFKTGVVLLRRCRRDRTCMVHSGVPKEQADEIADGWMEWYWNPLKEYFSGKPKPKLKNSWLWVTATFSLLLPYFWLRLKGKRPAAEAASSTVSDVKSPL